MKTAVRILLGAFLLLSSATTALAQSDVVRSDDWMTRQTDTLRFVVRGVVRDASNGKTLDAVAVTIPGTSFATVTNKDGSFVIKSDIKPQYVSFTLLGYNSQTLPVSEQELKVRLTRGSIELTPATVVSGDPLQILLYAISKIESNAPRQPELFDCFYRETVQKRQRFIYVSEAVTKMYKAAMANIFGRDRASQAGQGMALMFDIVPQEYKAQVAANLNQSIVDNNYFLNFGSVGSKFVPRVLAEYGYADTVYKMMCKEEIPSWGAWIKQGQTTLAEVWRLDMVTFHDASANHVFLGDISAWMVKYLAGIRFEMDADGGCTLAFKPCTPEGLDWAKAEYKSVRGLIKSEWHRTAAGIELKVTVPANMKATVEYGDTVKEIGGGVHLLKL